MMEVKKAVSRISNRPAFVVPGRKAKVSPHLRKSWRILPWVFFQQLCVCHPGHPKTSMSICLTPRFPLGAARYLKVFTGDFPIYKCALWSWSSWKKFAISASRSIASSAELDIANSRSSESRSDSVRSSELLDSFYLLRFFSFFYLNKVLGLTSHAQIERSGALVRATRQRMVGSPVLCKHSMMRHANP